MRVSLCCLFLVLLVFVEGIVAVTLQINGTIAAAKVPEHFLGFTNDWWVEDDPSYGKKWQKAGILTFK